MKKINQTITNTIVAFEALDGKVFTTKEECEAYEKTAECVLKAEFRQRFPELKYNNDGEFETGVEVGDLPDGYNSGEDEMLGLVLKNEEDLHMLRMYLSHFFTYNQLEKLTSDLIGKKLVLTFSYDGDWADVRTYDEYLASTRAVLDWLFNGRPKCSSCAYLSDKGTCSCPVHGYRSDVTCKDMFACSHYTAKTPVRCKDCAYLVEDIDGAQFCDDCGKRIDLITDKDCSANQTF